METRIALDWLSGHPLFEGVTEQVLGRHGLRLSTRDLRAGEHLFMNGDRRDTAWFLTEGWLLLRVPSPGGENGGATVEILGRGDLSGCAGVGPGGLLPYTGTALTDLKAVGLPAANFEDWLRADSRAAWRMHEVLDRRLVETAELRAINAERADLSLRLLLDWLSRKLKSVRIPATRVLLADLSGLRPETCSRALTGLRRRGVIRVSQGLIEILRPDLLAPARK